MVDNARLCIKIITTEDIRLASISFDRTDGGHTDINFSPNTRGATLTKRIDGANELTYCPTVFNTADVLSYKLNVNGSSMQRSGEVNVIDPKNIRFYPPNYYENKYGDNLPYYPICEGSSDLYYLRHETLRWYTYCIPTDLSLVLYNKIDDLSTGGYRVTDDDIVYTIKQEIEFFSLIYKNPNFYTNYIQKLFFNYNAPSAKMDWGYPWPYTYKDSIVYNAQYVSQDGYDHIYTIGQGDNNWLNALNKYVASVHFSSSFVSSNSNNIACSLSINGETWTIDPIKSSWISSDSLYRNFSGIGIVLPQDQDAFEYDFKIWESGSDPIQYYNVLPITAVTSGNETKSENNKLFTVTGITIPVYYTINVKATPENSTILINGEETNTFTGQKGESVTVEVSCEGYETYTSTITLTQNSTLEVNLKKIAQTYVLTVIPTPPESTVLINGEEITTYIGAEGDVVSIEVSCAGYKTYKTEHTLTEDIVLNISLEELGKEATLTIITNPENAKCAINNVETKEYTGYVGDRVSVLVEAEGYLSAQFDLILEEAETTRTVNLIQSGGDTVTFTILPIPEDADVLINGQLQTSVTVPKGTVITWQVSKQGYETQSGQVTPNIDTTITVSLISLKPIQQYFDYASYLANLLIIQYHDKPKAIQTIKALGRLFPIDLMFMVRDGFSLDTAVGKQLDILGKYLMVDRWYNNEGQYAQLDDEEFRFLIKFKAISNTTNMSYGEIDDALYNFFGNRVRATSKGNMEMTYFVPQDATKIVIAAIQKQVLPRPMGVQVTYIIEQKYKFFGFCNYKNQYAVYKTGFRDYNNPSKTGEMLNYAKRLDV